MKIKLIFILLFSVTCLFIGCENEAAPTESIADIEDDGNMTKPLPKLVGESEAQFTLTPPTFWNGTVDFGDHGVYGLTFFSYGEPIIFGQSSHFEEEFIIYKLNSDWANNPDDIYVKGWNRGIVALANKVPEETNVNANGKIVEASGPFEGWQGRIVHLKGIVLWAKDGSGMPLASIGTIQIN
jgi:hypothetical protein